MNINELLKPASTTWISRDVWAQRVLTFEPSWFLICMGTGILVQLCSLNFPYQSYWLYNLGYVFWIVDISCFGFFFLMVIARLIRYPNVAWSVFQDFTQTSFVGAAIIGWETIGAGIVIFYHGDRGAIVTAEVFWWFAVAMSLFLSTGGFWAMYNKQSHHTLDEVTGVWFLIFIPMIVGAAYGANLALYLGSRTAFAVLTVSFLMVSLGVGLSFVISGIYIWRLMSVHLPERPKIATTFVPIGPFGMGAYACISLSVALSKAVTQSSFVFNSSWEQQAIAATTQAAVAEMIIWIGVFFALFLLGIASFWLVQGIASVASLPPKSFTPGIWSLVFPLGVYTNAWLKLGLELRNNGMKVFGIVCLTITILLWLGCALSTFHQGVWKGKLFYAGGAHGESETRGLEDLKHAQRTVEAETALARHRATATHVSYDGV